MLLSPKKVLERYGLKAQKKLGQHFLINPFTSQQIVEKSGIEPKDIVIEIGAGLGALTIPLSQRQKR
ncbi:MAG: Ribosomal RNA small subunit methyltransferase A [Candidatus Methanoperedenaceae archaeon GB37]|nr:MAG: Ribosomal RNA small subunit methyltransferase A [Candidatus Methanoperedenaceae archaeon GB37]